MSISQILEPLLFVSHCIISYLEVSAWVSAQVTVPHGRCHILEISLVEQYQPPVKLSRYKMPSDK